MLGFGQLRRQRGTVALRYLNWDKIIVKETFSARAKKAFEGIPDVDETLRCIRVAAQQGLPLSEEEAYIFGCAFFMTINLLLRRFKQSVATSPRTLSEESIQIYRSARSYVRDAIYIIKHYLLISLKSVNGHEKHVQHVFYLKMKGDLLSRLVEMQSEGKKKAWNRIQRKTIRRALLAYKLARRQALKHLQGNHGLRLHLAIQLANFYDVHVGSLQYADKVMKEAYISRGRYNLAHPIESNYKTEAQVELEKEVSELHRDYYFRFKELLSDDSVDPYEDLEDEECAMQEIILKLQKLTLEDDSDTSTLRLDPSSLGDWDTNYECSSFSEMSLLVEDLPLDDDIINKELGLDEEGYGDEPVESKEEATGNEKATVEEEGQEGCSQQNVQPAPVPQVVGFQRRTRLISMFKYECHYHLTMREDGRRHSF